jgi:hypothetical protein
MHKLRPGAVITTRDLVTTRSQRIRLPDPTGVVHLQFRRYAGCPFCNLHLRSIVQRHHELVAAGIREVVVFQSSSAELLAQHADVPFAVVADPTRKLYAEFRVGGSPRAVLDPRAWLAGVRAVARKRPSLPASSQQALGLPAGLPGRGRRSDPGVQVRGARLRPMVGGRAAAACQPAHPSHRPPGTHMIGSRSLRGRPRPCIRPSAASCVSEGQAAHRTGLARAITELLAPANLAVGQLLLVGWHSEAGPVGLWVGAVGHDLLRFDPLRHRPRWRPPPTMDRPAPSNPPAAPGPPAGRHRLGRRRADSGPGRPPAAGLARGRDARRPGGHAGGDPVVEAVGPLQRPAAPSPSSPSPSAPRSPWPSPRSRWWPGRGFNSATTPQPRPWPVSPRRAGRNHRLHHPALIGSPRETA